MGKVIAAVDGSASARNAAVWAGVEAQHRGDTLRLVHTYAVPERGYPGFLATFPEVREGMRHQGGQWLAEAESAVREAAPGARVETDLVEGEAVNALLAESRDARMVVLGSRGLGGFTGMLVGSVAVALAAHGLSPVVVVRGKRPEDPPPTEGPVVVGLDGSAHSDAALTFAFEAAAARRVPVVAVHTWTELTLDGAARTLSMAADPAEVEREERELLERQLGPVREKYPDVEVEPVVARGRPVRTLLERGEHAQLIVVGSRGRGGFKGMLLGSTSQALVIHAPCPVAVVRPHEPESS